MIYKKGLKSKNTKDNQLFGNTEQLKTILDEKVDKYLNKGNVLVIIKNDELYKQFLLNDENATMNCRYDYTYKKNTLTVIHEDYFLMIESDYNYCNTFNQKYDYMLMEITRDSIIPIYLINEYKEKNELFVVNNAYRYIDEFLVIKPNQDAIIECNKLNDSKKSKKSKTIKVIKEKSNDSK